MSAGARPRVLVTGGGGQLGWELRRTLAPLGDVVAPGRAELDLSDPGALRAAVRALAPHAVVNAAAYTEVDRAESDPGAAHAVNAVAPGVLAEEAARAGALLVHFSTDYVFDGEKGSAYTEDDLPAPRSVYGRTKLEGERAVAAAGGAHLVFRTSWVYGTRGRNFMRTILRLAREREELRIVGDQFGAPTWSRMLAEATALVMARLAGGGGFAAGGGPWGVYHLAGGGVASWHQFADAIVREDPLRHEHACRSVVSISTSEYPTAAARPRYSVLDCTRAERTWGVRLPEWRLQLAAALES